MREEDAAAPHPVLTLEAAIRYALGSTEPPRDAWLARAIDALANGDAMPASLPSLRPGWLPFLPVALWGHSDASIRGPRLLPFRRQRRRRHEGAAASIGRPSLDPHRVPEWAAGAQASGPITYREWAFQRGGYRDDWCAVSEQIPASTGAAFDPASVERAAHVRRQFEAVRQQPAWLRRRENGPEIDIDAHVESAADARGCGHRSARIYRARAPRARSLSVAALMDASRSTEAWVLASRVIAIGCEGMLVLGEALDASGDDFALFAFASDTRLRVRCYRVKDFDERYGDASRRRLLALKPEDYTLMGAAVRHVGARLDARASAQKLLLLLTDGHPHDPADGYEGRYAIEDTRRALIELRARGIHCFGLAIDRQGREYLPRLFGPGRYALLSEPRALPRVLPGLLARMTVRA